MSSMDSHYHSEVLQVIRTGPGGTIIACATGNLYRAMVFPIIGLETDGSRNPSSVDSRTFCDMSPCSTPTRGDRCRSAAAVSSAPTFFFGPFVLNGSPPIAVVLDSTNPGREPYRTMNKKLNEGDYSSKHLVVHMNDKLIGSRARLVCSHTFVCAHAREYIRI